MIKKILKSTIFIIILSLVNITYSFAEIIKKFEFKGNERILMKLLKYLNLLN